MSKWYFVGNDTGSQIIESDTRPKTFYEGGTYSMIAGGYDTREELVEKYKLNSICVVCGDVCSFSFMEPVKSQMIGRSMCFSCNHWTNEAASNPANRVVIDGHLYSIAPEPTKYDSSSFLGMGGREFEIEFLDGRKVITHNLWSGGAIPERFRAAIPDNAKFGGGARKAVTGGITCWDSSR